MGDFFALFCLCSTTKVQFLHTFVAHYIVAMLYAIHLLHTTRSEKRRKKYPMNFSRVEKTLATRKKEIWIEPQWISKCVNKLVSANVFLFWSSFLSRSQYWFARAAKRRRRREIDWNVWYMSEIRIKPNGNKKDTFFCCFFLHLTGEKKVMAAFTSHCKNIFMVYDVRFVCRANE